MLAQPRCAGTVRQSVLPLSCAPAATCSILTPRLGFQVIQGMQRWSARFLLLIALAGTFPPLALQATAPPAQLCCRRAGEHHCHAYPVTDPEQPVIRDAGCNRDCCRVARTAQWARPEPLQIALRATASVSAECYFHARVPAGSPHCFQFGRAPPQRLKVTPFAAR